MVEFSAAARRGWIWSCALAAFALVLLVHGALPGLAMPTLGQGVWTASFGQSIANQHGLALYARDFGLPTPAPIPFGLAGALPCGWLILAGLHPADAYAAMVACWLALAFIAAFLLVREAGGRPLVAIALATLWLTLPMVWEHADYSMLSLGIALLPAYVLCSVLALRRGGGWLALPLVAALVAVFMDGYTFVMYAVMAIALVLAETWAHPGARVRKLALGLVCHGLALGLAYALYRRYAHPGGYAPAPLDFFRAWGLDLSFVGLPTRGEYLLWDVLGVGVMRTGKTFFGDPSTWTTTFCLPLLLLVPLAAYRLGDRRRAAILLLVLLAGFYLALGPSLKIDARRSVAPLNNGDLMMPASPGLIPTGTALLDQRVPGMSLMRASYRWAALALLAAWLLLAWASGRRAAWLLPALAIVVLCDLPHPLQRLRDGMQYRRMLLAIDRDFVARLPRTDGRPLAFAPYGNDFLAAYAAARGRIPTFNIGGDKGLAMAVPTWPASMQALNAPPEAADWDRIAAFLAAGTGAGVVMPYVNLLDAAHFWPCQAQAPLDASTTHRHGDVDEACVRAARAARGPRVQALAASPFLQVQDFPYFAFVSLRQPDQPLRTQDTPPSASYPIRPMSGLQRLALAEGWYGAEPTLVWSGASAQLDLPVPADCAPGACTALARFAVFGASPGRPVNVAWSTAGQASAWHQAVVANAGDAISIALPLQSGAALRRFRVEVPDAVSPHRLTGSADQRVLGIALLEIELVRGGASAAP